MLYYKFRFLFRNLFCAVYFCCLLQRYTITLIIMCNCEFLIRLLIYSNVSVTYPKYLPFLFICCIITSLPSAFISFAGSLK